MNAAFWTTGLWLAETLAMTVALSVILVSLLQTLLYLALMAISIASMVGRPPIRETRSLWGQCADIIPGISVLVPAYNEEATVVDSVRSLLALHYPRFEVIVVNDGSNDSTLETLQEAFDLRPCQRRPRRTLHHQPINAVLESTTTDNLLVIDKANGGKADALNAAVNAATMPLICTVDADSLLEADSLLRGVQPYFEDPDRTVAVGGTVRIANGCTVSRGRVSEVGIARNFLALIQTVEYLRAFMMARLALGRVGALTIVSGAFGLFRTDAVRAVGGYSNDTVGEDLELVIKLHRSMRDRGQDYQVAFVPEPVCWTQVPEDLATLARQRVRWQRGAIETLTKHGDMFFKPRYGRVAALGLGSMLVMDVAAPVIEVLGYVMMPIFWYFGIINWELFLAYLMLAFCFGIFVSVGALMLEEMELRRFPRLRHICILALIAIIENFGYRQLHNFWRIKGIWQYFQGNKSWGEMPRKAFKAAAPRPLNILRAARFTNAPDRGPANPS